MKVEAFLHHGLREEVKAKGFKALVSRFKDWLGKGWEVELVASNRHQAQRLVELLEDYGVKAALGHGERGRHVMVREGDLSRGFLLPREGLVFLTEEEIFGQKARAGPTPKQPPAFYNFEDLKPGDFVVHVDYGIGLYKGLVKLEVEGGRNEFLLIEYADGDRLYVPIERLNLVHRYVGPGDSPPRLDRLGGAAWRRAKRRARRAVQEVAKELVELYAARKALPGFSFSPPDASFREFEATFPRGDTGPVGGHRGGPRGHVLPHPYGPPPLWGRGLRQDGGGRKGDLQGRHGRETGGGAGAHHRAGRAALPHLQ